MPERWLGFLRGSRTGTLFLEAPDEGTPILTIGFTGAGDVRLRVMKTGEKAFELKPESSDEVFGTGIIETTNESQITGSWKFVAGAAGLFDLTRHQPQQEQVQAQQVATTRVWSREVPLGAVTLYRSDLQRLVAEMRGLIERPCTIAVRAIEAGNIVVEDVDTYLNRPDFVDVLRVFTISAEEITNQPLKRIATLRLEEDSTNIFVGSTEEMWTTAAAHRLESYVKQFTSRTTGWLRRYGLNINAFILIAILIWMPDRPLFERVVVFSLGVLVIAGIARSHRLIPFNRVYLDPEKEKKPFAKEVPAVVMVAVAGLVTTFLSSVPEIIEFVFRTYESLTQQLGR